MTDNNNNNDNNNVIDLDVNLYEELSLMAMREGQDDITKFINDLIAWGISLGLRLDDKEDE